MTAAKIRSTILRGDVIQYYNNVWLVQTPDNFYHVLWFDTTYGGYHLGYSGDHISLADSDYRSRAGLQPRPLTDI
jgi:hypothetical protein